MTSISGEKLKKNDWYIVHLFERCAEIDNKTAHISKDLIQMLVIAGFCGFCDSLKIVTIPPNSKDVAEWVWRDLA